MKPEKTYLGDSVYALYDGFTVTLTTENGYPDDPRNQIVLEPEVFDALDKFIKRTNHVETLEGDNVSLCDSLKAGIEQADRYTKSILGEIQKGSAHIAKVNPRLSDSCKLNAFGGSFWFTVDNREDVQKLLALAPRWEKKASDAGIDYRAVVDGVTYSVKTTSGALPPTCKLVEKEFEVPEQIIPAHVEKKLVLECEPTAAGQS
ncbi:MAG: hypothetical protein KGJ13_09930 [Patescibacteria group bacterium]|nr:hypothetical protein [Patescibacteria group bacterium]